VNFTVGGTIQLSVTTAASALPATNQWYKNEVAIAGETGSTLTINNATAGDMGQYHVTIANANGTATSARVLALTTIVAPGLTYQQDANGLTVIEAEHFFSSSTATDGHLWVPVNTRPNATGSSYMSVLPDNGANRGNAGFETNGPQLNFRISFASAGVNYLWVRGGDLLNNGAGDSVHAGFNDLVEASGTQLASNPNFQTATWNWSGTNNAGAKVTFTVPAPGTYNVNFWMREDGFLFDKLLLTTDEAFVPTGDGPNESQVVASGPGISISRAGGVTTITYDGTLVSSDTVGGTYTPVAGATSPYAVPSGQVGNKFYKAQQ
jgi:hypothetical protein